MRSLRRRSKGAKICPPLKLDAAGFKGRLGVGDGAWKMLGCRPPERGDEAHKRAEVWTGTDLRLKKLDS